jgi:co-chaperonin GroES (HSP10)
MGVVTPHKYIERISTSSDAKVAILDMIGDLSGVELIGDLILVAAYMRPEKTAGGIIRPGMNKEEDVWQGKVGLVLKWGPDAYRDKETGELYEQRVEVGEWGVSKVGDSMQLLIRDVPCRVIRDVSMKMKVKNPEIVM